MTRFVTICLPEPSRARHSCSVEATPKLWTGVCPTVYCMVGPSISHPFKMLVWSGFHIRRKVPYTDCTALMAGLPSSALSFCNREHRGRRSQWPPFFDFDWKVSIVVNESNNIQSETNQWLSEIRFRYTSIRNHPSLSKYPCAFGTSYSSSCATRSTPTVMVLSDVESSKPNSDILLSNPLDWLPNLCPFSRPCRLSRWYRWVLAYLRGPSLACCYYQSQNRTSTSISVSGNWAVWSCAIPCAYCERRTWVSPGRTARPLVSIRRSEFPINERSFTSYICLKSGTWSRSQT